MDKGHTEDIGDTVNRLLPSCSAGRSIEPEVKEEQMQDAPAVVKEEKTQTKDEQVEASKDSGLAGIGVVECKEELDFLATRGPNVNPETAICATPEPLDDDHDGEEMDTGGCDAAMDTDDRPVDERSDPAASPPRPPMPRHWPMRAVLEGLESENWENLPEQYTKVRLLPGALTSAATKDQ